MSYLYLDFLDIRRCFLHINLKNVGDIGLFLILDHLSINNLHEISTSSRVFAMNARFCFPNDESTLKVRG